MNIDLNKYTEMSRNALVEAQNEARKRHHQQIDVAHLFFALVTQEGGIVPSLLEKMNVQSSAVSLVLNRELEKMPAVRGSVEASRVFITAEVQDVFTKAEALASEMKDEYVSVEHIFLGIVEESKKGSKIGEILRSFNIDKVGVLEVLKKVRGSQRVTSANPEATYEVLEKYGVDLVSQVKKGKYGNG